jgi:hypothetical protein
MVGAMASGVGSALGKIGKLPYKKKKPEEELETPSNANLPVAKVPELPPAQKGFYDPVKKAFITDTGKTYPTNDPKFIPLPETLEAQNRVTYDKTGMRTENGETTGPDEWSKTKTLPNVKPALTGAEIEKQRQAQEQLTTQLAKAPENYQNPLTEEEGVLEQPFAMTAGAVAGIGAGYGATAGLATGPLAPVAVPAGAGIGALAGLATYMAKRTMDARQDVKNANKLATLSEGYLGDLINMAQSGQYTQDELITEWTKTKQNMMVAQSHAKQANEGMSKYLSGGKEEEVAINMWIESNMPNAERLFIMALQAPNPNAPQVNYRQGVVTNG